jgi:hypothetical protein
MLTSPSLPSFSAHNTTASSIVVVVVVEADNKQPSPTEATKRGRESTRAKKKAPTAEEDAPGRGRRVL